jgi:hypothetical protein
MTTSAARGWDNDTGLCEVCRREPAVGVGSSVFGAISLAYGNECLAREADAAFVIDATIYTIGPNPSDYAPWVWEFSTFRDGEYIPARQYFDEVVSRPGFFDPPPEETPHD